MERKIDCFKQGVEKPISTHNSIKEAAKVYFKGTLLAQRKIQKNCSGSLKSPLESEEGLIYFRYKY